MRGIDETWQDDLVEMIAYSPENKVFKYLLTVINRFSKYALAVSIKSKIGQDVTEAMKSILVQGRAPKNLHCVQGKDLCNSQFETLMQCHVASVYTLL